MMRCMFTQTRKEPIQTTAEIISKTPINHDSYIYKLKYVDMPLELGIGEHFRICETIKTFDSP